MSNRKPNEPNAPSGTDGFGKGGPTGDRAILHIDMNAFYCSVHEAVEPEKYKGKPLAVGGSVELRKGIIVTSSYAARARGVRTGMLVKDALRLCPELIVLEPDFELYRDFSRRFIQIAYSYSPLVETMSIDECFVDVTGSGQFGTPLEIAVKIQKRIREELGLPCSIGVAPNKLLAKMASDMKKPNGITVLCEKDVPALLWGKPCSQLYGIGRRTADKLAKKFNIRTIGELARADEMMLIREFGAVGSWMKRAANGIDRSPVNPVRERNKSIGHTTTLPRDFTAREDISRVFLNLSDQVARRMRKQQLVASTVQITIRDPDMKTITRAETIPVPTEHADDIHRIACKLFFEHWPPGKPVRLLGVTLQNLQPREGAIQLDLFEHERQSKKEKLNRTMDRIRDKYGENAILTLGMIGDDPSALIRDTKRRGTSLQMDHIRQHRWDEP